MTKQFNLKELNSFGIEAIVQDYIELNNVTELLDLIRDGYLKDKRVLVIGGGSNLLFRNDYKGLVLKPVFNQIRILSEDSDEVHVECDAGVEWDDFVEYCVKNNFGGIENLSYIPGNVGAAPIQNIGAYGSEVRSVIKEVLAIRLSNGEELVFNNIDCDFAYRNSIFKREYREAFLIYAVRFILNKNPKSFDTSYGIVNERVRQRGEPSLAKSRQAIISIRKEKLPEPEEIGNAGSFFKNPAISEKHFERICSDYKSVPSYPSVAGMVKVPAGWLIEKCGWKGFRRGDAGVHEKQALVIVNYGNAGGNEIYELSEEIIVSVETKFGIKLEREVNVI